MADVEKTQAAGTPKKDALKTDLATFFKLGTVAPKEYAKIFDPEDNDGYVLPKGVIASGIETGSTQILSNEDKLKAAHARLEELKKKKRQRDTTIEDAEEKHVRNSKVKKPKKVEEKDEDDENSNNEDSDVENDSDADMDVDEDKSNESGDEGEAKEEKEAVPLTEEQKKAEAKRLARQAARKRKSEARAAEREAQAKARMEGGNKKRLTAAEKEEAETRTLFVGNVPVNADKNDLKKLFSQYGNVESVRFRNITVNNPDKRLKSIIHQDYHPERDSMVAYVVFDSEACIKPAMKANGVEFGGKHLRVDGAKKSELSLRDYINCVYVSGLPFGAEEEDLREIFQRCGTIANIRIVRDHHYKAAKGFGYVRFTSLDGMNAAIALNLKVNYKGNKLTIVKAVSPEAIKQKKAAAASQHYRKPNSLADKYKAKSKKYASSSKRK